MLKFGKLLRGASHRVLISADPANAAMPRFRKQLEKLNVDYTIAHKASEVDTKYDVLCISPFTGACREETVEMARKLKDDIKWVHTFSTGVDSFAKELATLVNAPVTNARGSSAANLAEFSIAAMLHFSKRIPTLIKNQKDKKWEQFTMKTLRGKTVGFLGFGATGKAVARMCGALGMEVQVVRRTRTPKKGGYETKISGSIKDPEFSDLPKKMSTPQFEFDAPYASDKFAFDGTVRSLSGGADAANNFVDREEAAEETSRRGFVMTKFTHCYGYKARFLNQPEDLFATSDFVVCSLPYTPATHHLVGENCFAMAKPGCVFINVGRGQVVDQEKLIEYHSMFDGIALDVFEKEPLPEDSKLWTLDNVLISSHTAYLSEEWVEEGFDVFEQRWREFKQAKPFVDTIDLAAGF